MNRGPMMNRRRVLRGIIGLTTVAAAESTILSPALAAIRSEFKDANPRPNPADLEAWHQWFLKQETMFKNALARPEVLAVLEQPLDENFNAAEIDAVMEELLSKWPVAWNDHIRSFTDASPADMPLQKWVRGGLEKEFPVIALRFKKSNGDFIGNGALITVDGELMIRTAEHLLVDTSYKKGEDFWCGDLGDDTALIRASRYFADRNQPVPALPSVPFSSPRAHELTGMRVVISGHDDGVTLRNRIDKKLYVTTGIELTPAINAWRLIRAYPGSGLMADWERLVAAKDPRTRAALMPGLLKYLNSRFERFPYTAPGGLLYQLPPGEAESDLNGRKPVAGMSGGSGNVRGITVGVHSSSSPAYIENKCYSLGIVKMGTGTAIENYRAWKRTQKLARN